MDQTKRGPLSRAITAGLCIWAALMTGYLLRERPPAERFDISHRVRLFGQPAELVKFADFQSQVEGQFTQLELLHRLLLYADDLISVGQHNLAALFGLETYLVQQLWPNSTRALGGELSRPWATVDSDGNLEKAVRAPNLIKLFKSSKDVIKTSGEAVMSNDHRDCFNEVRDQGSCGSCYAFSLISLIEWHYCKQYKKPIDLSEQFIIDCGRATKLAGCVEGELSKAKNFCVHYGVKLERDWPYRGKDNPNLVCSEEELKRDEIVVKSAHWWAIEVDRELFERTLKFQPILIDFSAPKKFLHYKSGIHSGQSCDPRQPHGAVLVGDGVADGEEFWLIRNSFGADWGENGYMRLSKRADMTKCFDNALVGKFMFRYDEDAFEELYDTFEFYPPKRKVVSNSGMSKELLNL